MTIQSRPDLSLLFEDIRGTAKHSLSYIMTITSEGFIGKA